MGPFIHYNMIINKELNYVLEKNSIKYLMCFHKNNINSLFFKKDNFYNACLNNNLNIIKYIYNHLNNKNIDFNIALFNSCSQYNKKLFYWLCRKKIFSKLTYYNSLFYCIDYNNLKLFKFIIKKFDINIYKNNHELIYYSIKKKNTQIIKYFFDVNKNLKLDNTHELVTKILLINNIEVIKLLLDKINDFKFENNYYDTLETIIKLGYKETLQFFLEFRHIKLHIQSNIYKFIYCSFISNNLEIIETIISLNYHNDLDYNILFDNFCIHGNIKIIEYIYEKDNSIELHNYLNLKKIIKNKFYDIFLFIIKKKQNIDLNYFYLKEFEKIINENYFKILLNIDEENILYFYKFIHKNNLVISALNIYNLSNNLISYGQINKIEFILSNFPQYIDFNNAKIINDSFKSHNLKCIKYIIDKLNKQFDDYKYNILHYSYLHGVKDIIYELDYDNLFEFYSYEILLVKNILRNDDILIKKIIDKHNFDIDTIANDNIELVFKLGNIKILNLIIPKLNNFDFSNLSIIDELINNDNYEILNLIKNKITDFNFINNDFLLKICKFGNIKFIDWFLEINHDYRNYINSAFNTLIIYGHYEQAIYFYNLKEHKSYIDLTNNNFHLLIEVIKNDNLQMVQWFLNNFSDLNNLQFLIYIELQENSFQLIKYDNHEILNAILKKYKLNSHIFIKDLFIYSLKNYKSDCLTYLNENYNFKDYSIQIDFKNIFIDSFRNNYYEMIDFLIKNVNDVNWLYIISYFNSDFKNIFIYLLKNYYSYLNIDQELFFKILYNGNLNYIKNFIFYCKDDIDLTKISEDDYIVLMTYDNLEIFDYIYSLNNIDFNNNMYIIKLIINLNKSKLLKWFFDKFSFDNLHIDDDFCFNYAIIYKNLEILKLLYEKDDLEKFNDNKFNYLKVSSKINNLEIFRWLSNKFENIDYKMDDNILIYNALVSNNLYIFKYILNNVDIDINYSDGLIIITAFGNNYNEMIKFLFDKYDNINVLIKNEIVMKYAVEDADIEMLDLLYNYNNNFNLSIDNEYLFRIACKMDHIEVVKWLISKKNNINYSINNHEIFYYVCEHQYTEIALFIKNLNPELYKVIIKDNEIESFSVNKILNIEGFKDINIVEKCPICLENDSKLITECNHQYCSDCLKNLNDKNYNFLCPLCRNEIKNIQYIKKIEN